MSKINMNQFNALRTIAKSVRVQRKDGVNYTVLTGEMETLDLETGEVIDIKPFKACCADGCDVAVLQLV